MLDDLEARGKAAGEIAAAGARRRLARALSTALPGVSVCVEDGDIVLYGRLQWDDARVRWIARAIS